MATTNLNSLTATITVSTQFNASNTLSGYTNPLTNTQSLKSTATLGTSVATTVLNGADEVYSALIPVGNSATATLDLQNFTDVLGSAGISLVRVKSFQVSLLSSGQNALGSACSQIQIGGSGLVQPWAGMWTSGSILQLYNGGTYLTFANTSGGVAVTSGSRKVIFCNQDSTNSGMVQVSVIGGSV